MVDRVKPWVRVHGFDDGFVRGLVHGLWYMVDGVLQNVLLEHGGLLCIFPSTVHLDLGHLPETQRYWGRVGWVGAVVAHKILVSAPVPLYLIWPLNWV